MKEHMFANNSQKGAFPMVFKDRGMKKWASLMLPAHKKKLKSLNIEKMKKQKPDIDEQHLEQMNYKLRKAVKKDLPVHITYHSRYSYKAYKGKVTALSTSSLTLLLPDGKEKCLEIKRITDFKISTY